MTDDPHGTGEAALPAAAIRIDGDVDVDALLARIAAEQRARGRRVRGLLMTYPGEAPDANPATGSCLSDMVLVDIETRDEYLVSMRLGRGSRSCRADTQGFARASQVLRSALEQAPDLVICNRFGNLEAEGHGFASELLELMAHGVPLLTAVAARHVPSWTRFSGGAPVLAARTADVDAWLERTLAKPVGRAL